MISVLWLVFGNDRLCDGDKNVCGDGSEWLQGRVWIYEERVGVQLKFHLVYTWWCIMLWDITSLGSVQVVGFFDVAARFCMGDGPEKMLLV